MPVVMLQSTSKHYYLEANRIQILGKAVYDYVMWKSPWQILKNKEFEIAKYFVHISSSLVLSSNGVHLGPETSTYYLRLIPAISTSTLSYKKDTNEYAIRSSSTENSP